MGLSLSLIFKEDWVSSAVTVLTPCFCGAMHDSDILFLLLLHFPVLRTELRPHPCHISTLEPHPSPDGEGYRSEAMMLSPCMVSEPPSLP